MRLWLPSLVGRGGLNTFICKLASFIDDSTLSVFSTVWILLHRNSLKACVYKYQPGFPVDHYRKDTKTIS